MILSTPKLLINFGTTTETTGWVTHTQTSPNSGKIPKEGDYLEQNGIKFSTTSDGNFFNNNWTAPATDLPDEGAFVDIDGTEGTEAGTGPERIFAPRGR